MKDDPKCQLDFGSDLAVADGKGYVVCAGDTAMNSRSKIRSGTVSSVGPFLLDQRVRRKHRCVNMKTEPASNSQATSTRSSDPLMGSTSRRRTGTVRCPSFE